MSHTHLLNEATGQYLTDDDVIGTALSILHYRFSDPGTMVNSPRLVGQYMQLSLAEREHEVFACIYVDAQHRVIALEEMFRGTLTQTSVYPREVAKAALRHNAAAVILAHNHPSGNSTPSRADILLTNSLKEALALLDIHVLDHVIVCGATLYSFAENGLLQKEDK